ncbi:MAG: hypothetical protein QOE90_717 [Thermoplasmata archaeon]|jgi:hypothetical protein|nr:hypothetical protein [Thermoplasmata archaeon]
MRRVALLALLLAAPALLAGCFGASASQVDVAPYLPLNDAQPGRATEVALFLRSTSSFKEHYDVKQDGMPAGWTFEPHPKSLDLGGGKTSFLVARVTPALDATYGPHAFDVMVGDTRATVTVNVKDLGREPARAGVGAQVYYVLFGDNGTVLETNEPTVKDQPGVKQTPLDNGTPDLTPLKVYVGGQRGTPPPEPYNSTGCAAPPCYHPVIEGFDARLRDAGDGNGMVAGDTLVALIPKERAYTYAGNEQHPLYGQNLNFVIRVVSVDDLGKSCPLPVCTS